VFAADYPFIDVFWSMLIFFFWVIWIWILVTVLIDVFRRHDISGWLKAAWCVFMIVLPYLGVFVYLIARGHKMQEHAIDAAKAQDAAMREYIQQVTPAGGSADEIARLADLRDKGVISDAEFQQAKAKALA
jgi:chemotaxis signal transduction protein